MLSQGTPSPWQPTLTAPVAFPTSPQLDPWLEAAQTRLQAIASSDDLFTRVFGDKAESPTIQAIRAQWAQGDFSNFPTIRILDPVTLGGALGAYSASNQTIYLSADLLAQTPSSTDDLLGATGVLIEETFHWLDSLVGADTPGDEGELARQLMAGVTPDAQELARMRQENDSGVLLVDGQPVVVELSGDEAGNTLDTARSISPTTTTTTLSGWVGSIDGVDFYRFTLTQESQVWFRL
ncbi:MAG: hypothetical protein NZ482_06395, partial [Gloeomargarita sp. SKYG98]|nr:hypothetical protein [Gloeomargarita sp. SKYG98]